MTKRLTEKQKKEIVENFKSGINIDALAQKNNCTNSTVIRNLKKYLGDLKYKELFKKSKSLKENSKTNENQTSNLIKTNFDNGDFNNEIRDNKVLNENITSSNFAPIDSFFEIAPVDYELSLIHI